MVVREGGSTSLGEREAEIEGRKSRMQSLVLPHLFYYLQRLDKLQDLHRCYFKAKRTSLDRLRKEGP